MYDDEEMTAKKAKEAEGIETRSRRNRSRTRTRKRNNSKHTHETVEKDERKQVVYANNRRQVPRGKNAKEKKRSLKGVARRSVLERSDGF
jgi:hypothetical protein